MLEKALLIFLIMASSGVWISWTIRTQTFKAMEDFFESHDLWDRIDGIEDEDAET